MCILISGFQYLKDSNRESRSIPCLFPNDIKWDDVSLYRRGPLRSVTTSYDQLRLCDTFRESPGNDERKTDLDSIYITLTM